VSHQIFIGGKMLQRSDADKSDHILYLQQTFDMNYAILESTDHGGENVQQFYAVSCFSKYFPFPNVRLTFKASVETNKSLSAN
jgi:hypothetical protein